MNVEPQQRPSAFELLEDPFLLDHAQVKTFLIYIFPFYGRKIV